MTLLEIILSVLFLMLWAVCYWMSRKMEKPLEQLHEIEKHGTG